jgi:hypothetical protein
MPLLSTTPCLQLCPHVLTRPQCYKPQSAEISTLFNTFRQVFSCLISFYA